MARLLSWWLLEEAHTVAVAIEGEWWVWGDGVFGQLGLGNEAKRLAPTLVGAEAAFGGSPVLMVACGVNHTLVVTKDGALWSFGIPGGRLAYRAVVWHTGRTRPQPSEPQERAGADAYRHAYRHAVFWQRQHHLCLRRVLALKSCDRQRRPLHLGLGGSRPWAHRLAGE